MHFLKVEPSSAEASVSDRLLAATRDVDQWVEHKLETGSSAEIISELLGPLNQVQDLSIKLNAFIGRAHFERRDFSTALLFFVKAIEMNLPPALFPWLSHLAQQALVFRPHDTTPIAADILNADAEIFHQHVVRLLRQHADSPSVETLKLSGRYLNYTLAFYNLKTKYRYICVETMTNEDRKTLADAGIANAFLNIASGGPICVAEAVENGLTDYHWNRDKSLTHRIKEVASTLYARRKFLLSPFTGEIESTIHSLDEDHYLHKEASNFCIISQYAPPSLPYQDTAWIFPENRIILFTKVSEADTIIANYLSFSYENIVKYALDFRCYLNTKERKTCVGAVSYPHIGHHIWNEISGWSRLFSALPDTKIDCYAIWKTFQIFGGVRRLYPERILEAQPVEEFQNRTDPAPFIFSQKILYASLRDNHLTNDTASRVTSICYESTSPMFRAKSAEFRRNATPLVLLTIRLDNRSWLEQDHGIPEIINSLRKDFPCIGFIIDGLNIEESVLKSSTHSWMSLDQEQALVASILRECDDDAPIYNSIGCSVQESIVLADLADIFIAPVGAGMAKYRWIANKPGVAFSNESFLAKNSYAGKLYNHFRDGAIPSRFVGLDEVKDVEPERRGLRSRANFSMDWRAPYRLAKGLLTEMFPDQVKLRVEREQEPQHPS